MAHQFFKQHFISIDHLNTDILFSLFKEIDTMKHIVTTQGKTDILSGKIIACVFYEPSTRTFASFTSAAQRLGAGIIPFYGMTHSSTYKGETFIDTIRTIGCSADAIVLRHPEAGSAQDAAACSYVPVINAGDGGNEHPTQAVLDAYTMYTHFQTFEHLTVAMVGDPKHSRGIRSFAKVLAKLGIKKIILVSPPSLTIAPDLSDALKQQGTDIVQTDALEPIIEECDVIYANRMQKERFENQEEYEQVKNSFVITPHILEKAKPSMILMDPLPRVGEISPEVDSDPRAVYIKEEMQNAVYTRMALLKLILTP